jgi:hypothetical protein
MRKYRLAQPPRCGVDPTRRRSTRCPQGELGGPSIGPSGPCISSHRTRVRKASQRFVSLKAFSTEETNQRFRQSSAKVPSSNQWIITQPTLRLLIIRPVEKGVLAQMLAVRPQSPKHSVGIRRTWAPVGTASSGKCRFMKLSTRAIFVLRTALSYTMTVWSRMSMAMFSAEQTGRQGGLARVNFDFKTL